MTPKEKANHLILLMKANAIVALDEIELENDREWEKSENYFAKQCALICVVQIINEFKYIGIEQTYWNEVKTEIEKL